MYEDAQNDSVPRTIEGVDSGVLEARILSAFDLAVSKIGRFASQDRDDIATLARHNLITSAKLRPRAEDVLGGCVGETTRLRGSIELAVRIVADIESRGEKGHGGSG